MPTKTFQMNVSQSESESYISHYQRTLTFKHVNGNLEIIYVFFVRHSDRLKFFERTICLHIHGLSMSPLYSENRAITVIHVR